MGGHPGKSLVDVCPGAAVRAIVWAPLQVWMEAAPGTAGFGGLQWVVVPMSPETEHRRRQEACNPNTLGG